MLCLRASVYDPKPEMDRILLPDGCSCELALQLNLNPLVQQRRGPPLPCACPDTLRGSGRAAGFRGNDSNYWCEKL